MDDPDLPFVEAVQAGDDAAFDALMARHKGAVHRFVFRCVGNEEDAEELAQETFVRAFLNIRQFRPSARFSTWLFQIALNLCRDAVRSRRYRQRQMTDSITTEEGGERDFAVEKAGPDEALQQQERWRVVQEAIDELPTALREALILTALEERSHADAAAILKTTPKTVETRVYRARKALEKRLRGWLKKN